MALPRKDVKVNFDVPVHEAIRAICNRRGITMAEFCEQIVERHVMDLVHDATVLADEFRRAGIARDDPESPGIARDRPGSSGTARDDRAQPGTRRSRPE